MNKFYLTLLLSVSFVWAMAQQVQPTLRTHEGVQSAVKLDASVGKQQMESIRNLNSKSTESRWFYQPEAFSIFNPNGDFADYYAVNIFPDTTMLESGNQPADGHIFFHSYAVSMDPASSVFEENGVNNFNDYTKYSLDSIDLGYVYSRNTASTVVDTLVMQVQVNTWGYTLTSASYSWVQSIYGVSTMRVAAILHDTMSWKATSSSAHNVGTYKWALNQADSSANPARFVKALSSALQLAGGDVVKATFTFVPGYTWTPNVDSIQMYNEFSFLTFGNASGNIYPYYVENDLNTNQTLRTFAYRDNTDDTYEPAYFFISSPFPYQYHDVAMRFTGLNVGIENTTSNFSVSQNQPNPFNGTTTINYSLDKAANVSLSVYNVAGALVINQSEGFKNAGNHQISLDGSNLPAGVYYYTFVADNQKVTKKMIVY